MASYPLPGLSCSNALAAETIEALSAALPAEGRALLASMDAVTGWEWTLHWYLSQWGGPTATINGWCYGSMMVVQWRAPHEGDDLVLVTCIFKANDETKFSTVTIEEMGRLVQTA